MIKYFLFFLFSTFIFNTSIAQDNERFGTSFYKNELKEVVDKWRFSTDSKTIETINSLKLWDNNSLNFFIDNIEMYRHVKALSISVKIKDFSFLEKMPNLKFLSYGGKLNSTNINSLIDNLNHNSNIYLLKISKYTKRSTPLEINDLKYIKGLNWHRSNIRDFHFHTKLENLVIEYNIREIKSIETPNIHYLTLTYNNLKALPEGVKDIEMLKGITIFDFTEYEIGCPISGFDSLIYFDAVGAKGIVVGRDCFENKEIKSIWGNVYEEYYLNKYKNEE